MATTYTDNGGNTPNGSHLEFTYTFPAILAADVKVALDGVTRPTNNYTTSLTPAKITFNSTNIDSDKQESTGAPKTGVVVRVWRDTDVESAKAVFAAGSSIRAQDLNNNMDQFLYAAQEEQGQPIRPEDLYLNDNIKLQIGTGKDLSIYHDGSHSIIENTTGNLHIKDDVIKLQSEDSQSLLTASKSGAVEIFYNNVKKAETYGSGLEIFGNLKMDAANRKVELGSGSTLQIYHDGSHGLITNGTGDLQLKDDVIKLKAADGQDMLSAQKAGPIELFHNNSKKAETYASGLEVFGNLKMDAANRKVQLGSGNTLQIYHDGSHAVIANTTGNLHIKDDVVKLQSEDGQSLLTASKSAAVEVFYNNVKKAETYGSGLEVFGSLKSTGITGDAVVTSGTSSSDTKVYSAKRAEELFFNATTSETIKDGDTFPDNDTSIATTAAINDRIIDLVDDVGGFWPIANETSFPTANPDVNNGAGTIVSIKALASTITTGSGVTSKVITNGAGAGNNVTINGLTQNTTYAAGMGMLVETTTTLHTYNFHRLAPKATEITTVAGNITNINTVATNISNVNTVATNISNVNSVASNSTNINTVATNNANITTTATNIAKITTVADDLNEGTSEIDTVATNIANVNNVGNSIANVNSCATNLTAVEHYGDTYQIATSAPTTRADSSALVIGDLWFDSSSNKQMMVRDGSAGDGYAPVTPAQSVLDDISIVSGNITYAEDLGSITDALTTGTGNSIETCADNIAKIQALGAADAIADMNTLGTAAIVADMNLLGTADCVADMALLATTDCIADMNTLANADVISDMNTLATADIVSDMNTLATADVVADLNTLATADIVSDMNTLATSANVTAMDNCSGSIANINTTSGSIANVNTTAGSITNVNTTAGSISNVNTVAGAIADVNRYANEYKIASSAPGSPSEGDLWYDSTNNLLKYYTGSAWTGISDAGINNLLEDTTPELGGHLDCNDKNLTEVATVSGDNLQIDFGTL